MREICYEGSRNLTLTLSIADRLSTAVFRLEDTKSGVKGSGFRVWSVGLGFGVQGLGCMVEGLGFRD